MLDNKGNFYMIEAILAVILILVVFLVLNTAISMNNPSLPVQTQDIKTAQDTMEILSGKINFTDHTFIGDISEILENGKNSKESVREVSSIVKNKLNALNLKNFEFRENNILDGKVLASSGDSSRSDKVSVATRTYGDYSYTLSVWQ